MLLFLLIVAAFVTRFLPRMALRNAIVSDTYFHLYCAKLIRKHRFRIPRTLPGVILPHEYTYPCGYHLLLALFPEASRAWVERGTAAFFDAINTWIVFVAANWMLARAGWAFPGQPALVAAALYAFSPALLRVGSGPRAYNGSARVPGQTLYLLHLLAAYHGFTTGTPSSIMVSVLAGAVLIPFAIFSTQALFFFAILFSAVISPAYLLVVAACLATSGLLSLGRSFRILWGTVKHLILYARHLQQIFLYPSIVSWRDYSSRAKGAFAGLARLEYGQFLTWFFRERYPAHLLLAAFPQVVLLPWAVALAPLVSADRLFLATWCANGVLWFVLTRQRPLLFLGEGERYLEAIMLPSVVLVTAGFWNRVPWLLGLLGASFVLSAVHLVRDYRRSHRVLHQDFTRSEPVFEALAQLPPGNVFPVGWVHWQAIHRSPFPVLTYGGNIDLDLLPLEEFFLVYGNYPYPGAAFTQITQRYDIKYILAERGCLRHYVKQVLPDPKVFSEAVVLLKESETLLLFAMKDKQS